MRLVALGSRLEAAGHKPPTLNLTAHSLQPMAAASRFGRYGPMGRQEVRQADITGQSYAEQVKRTREMLRSMDPETVKQVIEVHRDLTVFEALALAKRERSIIVPNGIHDRILTETTDEQYLRQNYPLWTGTLVIYEKPDRPFGEQVVFSWEHNQVKYSISFNIPEQFRGKRNGALVVEHPDFDLIALGNNKYELRIDGQNVHQIDVFPKKDGCYIPHAETGVPHGENAEANSNTRHLYRLNDSSYMGLLVRSVDYNGRQVVRASWRASFNWFGVALMPLAAATEKSDLHD